MKSKLLYHLSNYKRLINNENDSRVLNEMSNDLKNILIENSKDIELNYYILESFHVVNSKNDLCDIIYKLEDILTEDISIPNIKKAFASKHDKIIERDKKWLNSNKKKLLGMDFEGVELEVLSDYKVTFEQLLNRHNIFDKLFVNSKDSDNLGESLRRFEDKNENLKNGLDNYFRTGTSRREIGLRKLSGEEAKVAVENMVAYCESFLSGRKFIEEKMNNIIISISDESVKESLSPIDKLRILLEEDASVKDIMSTSKEISTLNKKSKSIESEKVDDENKPKEKNNTNEEDLELEGEPTDEEDLELEDEPTDEGDEKEQPSTERGINDRQIGVAVLLTVAEERYFDYINLLKGLIEE
jgi:hypothetical protein